MELWDAWMADREIDGLDNAVYQYQWRSMRPHFGPLLPSALTADHCRQYARARFDAGRANATVHTELSRLRRCLMWAEQDGRIDRAPRVWRPSAGKPRQLVISFEDMHALAEAAQDEPHIYLFVRLLMATGARHRAVLDLTWDRVDLASGIVNYDRPKAQLTTEDRMSRASTKGRAAVPLSRDLADVLAQARLAADCDYVISYHGKPIASARKGFANAVKRAGIHPQTTPHTLRHSLVTLLRQRGADVHKVAHLVGHADIKTTMSVYSHLDPEFARDVVALLEGDE